MPRTFVWNETEPDGSEPANQIDEIIVNLKTEIRELLNQLRGTTDAAVLEDPLRIQNLLVGASPPAGAEIARIAGSIRIASNGSIASPGNIAISAEGNSTFLLFTNGVTRFSVTGTGAATFANTLTVIGDAAVGTFDGGERTFYIDSAAGNNRSLAYRTGTILRWTIRANNEAESGATAGSNLNFDRYNDAGGYLSTPLTIVRSTGDVFTGASLFVGGVLSVSSTITGGTIITTSGTESQFRLDKTGGSDNTSYFYNTGVNLGLFDQTNARVIWEYAFGANTVTFSSPLIAFSGISGNGSSLTALNAANIATGTLAIARGGLGVGTTPVNGAVPIGNGSGYNVTTITAGANISVTNGSGTITIAATGGGVTVSGAGSTSVFSFASFSGSTLTLATSSLRDNGGALESLYSDNIINGVIRPEADSTRDLGTTTEYWRSLYVGATIGKRFNAGNQSGSVSIDLQGRTFYRITLIGNLTITAINNFATGQSAVIEFVQNSTGGYTVTFPSSVVPAPVVGTTANRKTCITMFAPSGSVQLASTFAFDVADTT